MCFLAVKVRNVSYSGSLKEGEQMKILPAVTLILSVIFVSSCSPPAGIVAEASKLYIDDPGAALWGPAAGKDGLDVTVEVIDTQSGDVVGRATTSNYNVTAGDYTELLMAKEVSKKIAEFLACGQSK